MSRRFLGSLLLLTSLLLAVLVALAGIDVAQTGSVQIVTVALLSATIACLVILLGVYTTEPGPTTNRPLCTNCGTRVYETRRSFDRRRVLTCFACGTEWVMPPAPERPQLPPGPRPVSD